MRAATQNTCQEAWRIIAKGTPMLDVCNSLLETQKALKGKIED